MRLRAPALLLTSLAACAFTPPIASAADSMLPYKVELPAGGESILRDQGFDMHEGHLDVGTGSEHAEIIATKGEVAKLKQAGATVTALEIDAPVAKDPALGDSPNEFFNVYRTYMEPGGIKDEMLKIAADNPDVFKSVKIGTSTLGKPIYALKMTENARNVQDGTRDAILYSSVNHAREWIAAEMGRRLPGWFAAHKNDPKIRELIQTRELWFLPIQNPDGYDYTFTCGVGISADPTKNKAVPCDYRTLGNNPSSQVTNRYWRKTLRDNNGNGVYGEPSSAGAGDGVDPNRNYPAKRGIDEEGASNSTGGETYRGPYALSEPENLAVDRLQRRVKFRANINYHSAGQLLLTPVSYTTDYYPPDSTLFDAITGTDGDEAVFPYRSQHSSDLYESNGDTIDNAYMNYGIIGWTPEMDTCSTLGDPHGCNQFASPDDEEIVEAVFQKNLQFALNVTKSLPNMGRPKEFEDDPSHYQIKATQDIQPKFFDVSYGVTGQQVEAVIRKELGPSFVSVNVVGQTGNANIATIRMTPAPAGERYNEVNGYYFERRRATIPSRIDNRDLQVGDIVNVVVKAAGLQQEFRYRIEAKHDDLTKKRVLVVAAEDYTGKSPNVDAGYDTAPRYLTQHVAALEAAGYEVETFNIDAPPANGGTANGVVRPQIKYPTQFGVLAHFDAVNYYSGDDFVPQDASETDPRRLSSVTGQTGSFEMAPWAHKVMIELREYANEGGKLLVDGRNVHQAFTSNSASLGATGPYNWTPDKLYGFFYPPNNGGDDDLPGTAWQRSRASSNDTWQNYLGVIGRQSGIGTSELESPTLPNGQTNNNPLVSGYPVAAKAGGLFDGMAPLVLEQGSAGDPNEAADGSPLPLARKPLRLRDWGPTNEPLRAERIEADYATPIAYPATTGGAAISTRDAVTFGFGLEQLTQAQRNEVVQRAMQHLLPTTADTKAPTINGFKYPANNYVATPNDPVDLELTAFDERGDMDKVDLFADGVYYATTEVYPFQFRYTPPASAVGKTVRLTAKATDAAGNVATSGTLFVNVVTGQTRAESPVPVGPATLDGIPQVGETLTCVSGGFTNGPESFSYAWLRNGAVIEGATAASYTLTTADLGRSVACQISATNSAGTADSMSDSVIVSPAAVKPTTAAPAPAPAAPTTVQPTARAERLTAKTACKLASSRKAVNCTITRLTPKVSTAKIVAAARLQGTKKTYSKSSTKASVKVTVRSTKRLKKGAKVVVSVKSGSTTKNYTVKSS